MAAIHVAGVLCDPCGAMCWTVLFFLRTEIAGQKVLLAKTHFNVHRTVQLTVRPFRLYLFPKRVLCRQNCCTGRTSVHCLATFGQIFSISFCPPPPPTISSLSVNPAPPPPAPPLRSFLSHIQVCRDMRAI